MPKRILILTADAGFGHRKAAEALEAALHELCERLAAATNYVAAGQRISELAGTANAEAGRRTPALEKALEQLDRAGEVVRSLQKLLAE